MIRRTAAILALVAWASFAAAGCAVTHVSADPARVTTDVNGLERVSRGDDIVVYTRPGVPSLARGDYSKFVVEHASATFGERLRSSLRGDEIDRLRRYFRDTVVEQLRAHGYQAGAVPGRDVMLISFHVRRGPPENGDETLEIEACFTQSATGRLDAVTLQRIVSSRPGIVDSHARAKHAFDAWAERFCAFLDRAHGKP